MYCKPMQIQGNVCVRNLDRRYSTLNIGHVYAVHITSTHPHTYTTIFANVRCLETWKRYNKFIHTHIKFTYMH